MRRGAATAKLNLALVVGPVRPDGKHEVVTVYQRLALSDRIVVERAPHPSVDGFEDDTLVCAALEALAEAAGPAPEFAATILKRIPVAAGLGGGSSDAATALRLANELLDEPLSQARLHELAAALGADVPFFLYDGPQLGTGDGTTLEPLDLPQDYWVLLVHPDGAAKASTGEVYTAFDERSAERGFGGRRSTKCAARATLRRSRRTTSRRRRWRPSCGSWAPSVRTSRAPGRSSTGSSSTVPRPARPRRECGPVGESGSPHQRGTVDADGVQPARDRERQLEGRSLAEGAAAEARPLDCRPGRDRRRAAR